MGQEAISETMYTTVVTTISTVMLVMILGGYHCTKEFALTLEKKVVFLSLCIEGNVKEINCTV